MMEKIIEVKMRFHAGMSEKAIQKFKPISHRPRVIVKVNQYYSKPIKVYSSPYYQGLTPSSFIWTLYINPMLLTIEYEYVIYNAPNTL